ncbi:MAG: hypothetical protein HC867_08865 [Bacteroidia bacterium]|nr:hypothetical protein [Bacteroidia bacterium]
MLLALSAVCAMAFVPIINTKRIDCNNFMLIVLAAGMLFKLHLHKETKILKTLALLTKLWHNNIAGCGINNTQCVFTNKGRKHIISVG